MLDPNQPMYYEIRTEGVLDNRWATWFAGLQVTTEGSQTILSGPLPDQSALYGVLARVRDLGLSLISVRRLDAPEEPDTTETKEP